MFLLVDSERSNRLGRDDCFHTRSERHQRTYALLMRPTENSEPPDTPERAFVGRERARGLVPAGDAPRLTSRVTDR